MATIKDYFEFSQLAQASYALLDSDGELSDLLQGQKGDFSPSQADAFVDLATGYTVVTDGHQPDDATGFSATVFRSNETDKLIVAIRGTDGVTDLLQDGRLATAGYARDQIYSLYNYIQRLATPRGDPVSQWVPAGFTSENGAVVTRYTLTGTAQNANK